MPSHCIGSGEPVALPRVRVFVDIGAHYGETLQVALNPKWGFDRIHALEPSSACFALLKRFRDKRLHVEPTALGARNSTARLYGAGLLGASLIRSKKQKAAPGDLKTEQVKVRRARDWYCSTIPEDAEVFVKFNCEGSECDIIDDWLAAGLGPRLTSLYIDFDIRKVPGQAHRQAETEEALRRERVRYETSESLKSKGNAAVEKWLDRECPNRPTKLGEDLRYRLALYAPLYTRATLAARSLLPKAAFNWLAKRHGRMSRAS